MAELEENMEGIENQDDLALVKKMQDGREQIVNEIKKSLSGSKILSMSC